jgi:hypothetical protein
VLSSPSPGFLTTVANIMYHALSAHLVVFSYYMLQHLNVSECIAQLKTVTIASSLRFAYFAMQGIILFRAFANNILFHQLAQLLIVLSAMTTLINVSSVCMDIYYIIKPVSANSRTVCNALVVFIVPNVLSQRLLPLINLNVYLKLFLPLIVQFQIAITA